MSHTSPENVYRARVRSYQTDLNGVVWHGAFLGLFDDARIETFRRLGYTYERVVREGWQLVVRRVECEYLSPAFMDDLLDIRVTVPRLTRATMSIHFRCARGHTPVAQGTNTYVFLDSRRKPLRVPPALVALVEEHADMLEYPLVEPGVQPESS